MKDAHIRDTPVTIVPRQTHRTCGTNGFTLMEVALAVSVVVIGLMALFALVSSGLDSSTLAVKDTHAAIFADNVYNGIRAASQARAEKGYDRNTGDVHWRVFWREFAHGETSITVAASQVWDPQSPSFEILASQWKPGPRGQPPTYEPLIRTNRFDNKPQHDITRSGDPLVNHAVRYRLEIRPGDFIDPNKQSTWIKWDRGLENTNLSVTLLVWPGEFGSTNDPIVFYSEFDNPGDL